MVSRDSVDRLFSSEGRRSSVVGRIAEVRKLSVDNGTGIEGCSE